ncbi:MAG: carboxypeptidase-like regulatory domain-containing protein [Bacteroidales bacterium]|nr:carboxypeptidase-like regulatory domain-containing protein [Bacteroidales bacterium]
MIYSRKINRKLLLAILFILVFIQAQAQTFVKGRIIDTLTRELLSFANVAAPGTGQGDMTNIDGDFNIRLSGWPICGDKMLIKDNWSIKKLMFR